MTQPDPQSKAQTRREWTVGHYPTLARIFLPLAAELVDAVLVGPDDRVLDVACGTGNVALTAWRGGAQVTGVDITPAMLDAARERAAVIDADVDWREGDAAALPFPDDSFDVTLSCLGHMFVPDAKAAGDELLRVTKPGGAVAYTAWTPESGIAAMMRVLVAHLPVPPDDSPPPFLWGDPDVVRERLGDRVEALRDETGTLRYPAASPAHFWESMKVDSGAIALAVETVDEAGLPALDEDVVAALDPYFSDAANAVELEYRVVTATVP